MGNLKYLFWFHCDNLDLVEVKRVDIQSDLPSELYYWLISYSHGSFKRLNFKSMEATKREFAEGKLSFSESEAHFENTSQRYSLRVMNPQKVDADLMVLVGQFFTL